MKIILVIATALWCVSVLSDVNATVIEPSGLEQENLQEPVPEPLNSINEPLRAKRVRRAFTTAGSFGINCDVALFSVIWTSTDVKAVDFQGDQVKVQPISGSNGVECESSSSPNSVTCKLVPGGHFITFSCNDNDDLQVTTTDTITKEILDSGTGTTSSVTLTFLGLSWKYAFSTLGGPCPKKVEMDSKEVTVEFPNLTPVTLTYAHAYTGNKGGKDGGDVHTTLIGGMTQGLVQSMMNGQGQG